MPNGAAMPRFALKAKVLVGRRDLNNRKSTSTLTNLAKSNPNKVKVSGSSVLN